MFETESLPNTVLNTAGCSVVRADYWRREASTGINNRT